MLDVKNNFKNKYSPNCDSEEDDQKHLLACSKLVDGMDLVDTTVNYEDIYSSNVEEILKVPRLIQVNFLKKR